MFTPNKFFPKDLAGYLYQEIEYAILELSSSEPKIFFSVRDRLNFLYSTKRIHQQIYQITLNWLYKYDHELLLFVDEELDAFLNSAKAILAELFFIIDPEHIPIEYIPFLDQRESSPQVVKKTIYPNVRAEIITLQNSYLELSIASEQVQIIQVPLDSIDKELLIQIKKIKNIYSGAIPVYVHGLIYVEEMWKFEHFILFPDFLIDVTAIAECFDNKSNAPIKHFISLFRNRLPTKSILIGTAANEFLDELILDKDQSYQDLMLKVFRKFALGIAALNEEDMLDFIYSSKNHFEHLQKLVANNFDGKILHLNECLLEPSFYSVEFGIQGRLDILYDSIPKKIIELKSGKPFNPNSEGISASHQAQAILYKMLLDSVFGKEIENEAWILYSVLTNNNLRKALDQKSIRKKLIGIRNALILIHMHMAMVKPQEKTMFDFISEEIFEGLNSFSKRDGIQWYEIYSSLADVEKEYIKQFSYFNSRELLISKCGLHGRTQVQGLASMWLLNKVEKQSQFSLLSNLSIAQIHQNNHEAPILVLKINNLEDKISHFRIGDTLVMYPDSADGKGMLKSMVYKCTLIHFDNEFFHIRLRGRQFFWKSKEMQKWCLESDNLDRSFLYQYSGLHEFASSNIHYRSLILGIRPPEDKINRPRQSNSSIDEIVDQSIQAKEYFLLWGPPGSGKTSVFLKKLLEKLTKETSSNILLLAYTNRAVDEICEVIQSISRDLSYLRIGSRFGTRSDFHEHLLDTQINRLNSKTDLLNLLNSVHIITATVSSIHGKPEIFELKQFETVIIDEASQILEPHLIGFLSRFKKFILIGDHLQLPAVSLQDSKQTRIESEGLNSLFFKNSSESLFERLFRQCIQNKWTHAYNMLHKQGRMHEKIMHFPSKQYYNNSLKLINEDTQGIQKMALEKNFPVALNDNFGKVLSTERNIFIHVEATNESQLSKSNQAEAQMITYIVQKLKELYDLNGKPWSQNTCGIITPFRVQISTIQNALNLLGLNNTPMTIDTVERYQGSARDIILISSCVKSSTQLEQIISLNEDQVDRKLNVALTRAREQIILIGNKNILAQSEMYSQLIHSFYSFSPMTESI